ncbi:hypothetical protein JQM63_01455 [Oscillibacter valericigenes]|nr:hypothetical protein [Oscillibacter valericigenes]
MILEKEREEVTSEAEQLADSVSNEAAPVETAPRKMVKCPSKTGINMNQREKRTGQVLTLVIGLAVILLMAGLVARFGVMEQYRRLSEAQSAYGEVHSQLAACQEKLTDYELVLTEYRSCSLDGMTEGEDQLITVSRQAVLDLVEGIMMPRGKVISVNILDDTADVEMSGMSLDQISTMFAVMEAEPIVRSVELNMAATEENTASAQLNFSVRIYLGPERAVEE